MPATWTIFQKELELILKLKQSQNFSEFSDKFSSAFSRSTLNLASTPFGQPLIYGNYDVIKSAIRSFLDFNKNIETNLQKIQISLDSLSKFTNEITVSEIKTITSDGEKIKYRINIPRKKTDQLDENSTDIIDLPSDIHPFLRKLISPLIRELNKNLNEIDSENKESLNKLNKNIDDLNKLISSLDFGMIPYLFLELAVISFWSTAKFSPIPPTPPTIAPLFGTAIITPGIPGILSISFKSAFTSKDPEKAAEIITKGFEAHAKTISGTYSGLIAGPTGPIPSAPIPWVGII